jgi:hypothetical protein
MKFFSLPNPSISIKPWKNEYQKQKNEVSGEESVARA